MNGFRTILSLAAAITVVTGCGQQSQPVSKQPEAKIQPDVEQATPVGTQIPAGGIPILEVGEAGRQLNQGPGDAFAEFETVSGEGAGFQNAIRARVTGQLPEKAWYTQVSIRSTLNLKQGETVLISFWARTIATKAEDGMGDFLIYFGIPAAEDTPADELVKETIMERRKVGKEWKQFLIPRRVPADYEAALTRMNLDFGYALQTLEFAGIQVYQYPDRSPEDLPSSE